jgi:hypothetical protein
MVWAMSRNPHVPRLLDIVQRNCPGDAEDTWAADGFSSVAGSCEVLSDCPSLRFAASADRPALCKRVQNVVVAWHRSRTGRQATNMWARHPVSDQDAFSPELMWVPRRLSQRRPPSGRRGSVEACGCVEVTGPGAPMWLMTFSVDNVASKGLALTRTSKGVRSWIRCPNGTIDRAMSRSWAASGPPSGTALICKPRTPPQSTTARCGCPMPGHTPDTARSRSAKRAAAPVSTSLRRVSNPKLPSRDWMRTGRRFSSPDST